jgi:hypothetical protein
MQALRDCGIFVLMDKKDRLIFTSNQIILNETTQTVARSRFDIDPSKTETRTEGESFLDVQVC